MKKTREILKEYGYRPRREKGQNFLVREATLQRIVDSARVRPGETVVEIGPGPGNLTRRLARVADRVVAIEIERELAMILRAEVEAANVEVIESDVLEVDFASLGPPPLKLIANLPYYITTPVLFKLLATPELFSEAFLLLQLEVARRVCARPGGKTYGILAAQARLSADCEVLFEVPARDFKPKPKVDSALVRLRMLAGPRAEVASMESYRRLVRAAFAKKRKTLRNSLLGSTELGPAMVGRVLEEAGVDPRRRAETLEVSELAKIANLIFQEKRDDWS